MNEPCIGLTLADSTPPPVVRPYDPDAPNMLVMVLDDLEFTVETGRLPPLDFDAELDHAMRHQ